MILLLSVVVSLDGFTAALSYGAQRIRLTASAILIVCLTSGLSIFTAMTLGDRLGQLLSAEVRHYLGSGLLIGLGCYVLWQQRSSAKPKQKEERVSVHRPAAETTIARVNVRALGLIIQILHDPAAADQDHSGVITWQESFALGVALALDAFGAGIGAALTGLPPKETALAIGTVKMVALLSGWEIGCRLQEHFTRRWFEHLPGLILICLGLFGLL